MAAVSEQSSILYSRVLIASETDLDGGDCALRVGRIFVLVPDTTRTTRPINWITHETTQSGLTSSLMGNPNLSEKT